MNGRRPVTDPRSGQPGGSTAFLATLDGNLPAGGSAIVTVLGTTRKEKVTTVFPGSYSYAAGTQVLVMEVGGRLCCWVDSSATDGTSDCDCCDLRNCVDHGAVTDCSAVGEAVAWLQSSQLTLPTPFCQSAGSNPGLQHVGGCVWESNQFNCASGGMYDAPDVFLWRLTASPFPAKLELIHVSGANEIPAVVYYALKPFTGLCGNEFWLHSAPGPNWAKDHPGWAGDAFSWNAGLSSHVCLGPSVDNCLLYTGGPVPEYMLAHIEFDPALLALYGASAALVDLNGDHLLKFTPTSLACYWQVVATLESVVPELSGNAALIRATSSLGFGILDNAGSFLTQFSMLPPYPPVAAEYWSSRSAPLIFPSDNIYGGWTPGRYFGTGTIGPA